MINVLDSVKPYELQSVTQTLDLFNILSGTREMLTLSHLSRCVGISKNKMFRLLATLEQHGIVKKSAEGWYRFGGMAFAMAHRITSSGSIADHARPVMTDLAGSINESVYLASNENGIAILIDLVDCNQAIRAASFVGSSLDIQINDAECQSQTRFKLTNHSLITMDIGGLDAEITTVSAPVNDSRNKTCGALVVLAPSFRMPVSRAQSEIASALYSAAAKLSGMLSAPIGRNASSRGANIADQITRSFDGFGSAQPLNYSHHSSAYQQQM